MKTMKSIANLLFMAQMLKRINKRYWAQSCGRMVEFSCGAFANKNRERDSQGHHGDRLRQLVEEKCS